MSTATKEAPLRFDCPMCQFAYECGGSHAWHCDACGSSHDLRENAQFSLVRDDDSVNRAVTDSK